MRAIEGRIARVERALIAADAPSACPGCKGQGVLSVTFSGDPPKGCSHCGRVSVHMIIGDADDPKTPDPARVAAGI